jgi:acetyl esterase/lipase
VGSDLLIGGESAGATLAAGTSLRIRDELGAVDRIAGVNLVYGGYDFSMLTPSSSGVRATSNGDVLDVPGLHMLYDNYLAGLSLEQRRDPGISALYADLRTFPRALVTVGLDDHALDDSLFFANRLAAAGNRVELTVYPDSMHGFLSLPTKMAAHANGRIDDFMVDCLGARRAG